MPVYTTTLPNGQSVRVMGPANATPETVQQAALQIAAQRTPVSGPDTGERNYSLGTAASKAFSRGTERLKSGFGDVIPAMVGKTLGFDEFAERQMQEAQASEELIQRKYAPQIKSYKDVDGVGSAIKFGAETIFEQIPNLATMLVPGLAAPQVARIGAGKLAATELAKRQATAQGIGVYMGSYALNAPEVFKNIYEETGELATGTAVLFGAAAAALDSVLPSAVLKNITSFEKSALAASVLRRSGTRPGITKSVLTGIAKGSGAEALTEGAQEAISISAENFVAGNSQYFDSEDWGRVMESAVRGAVAGGTFRGISEPFGRGPAEPGVKEAPKKSDLQENALKTKAIVDVTKETAEKNMKKKDGNTIDPFNSKDEKKSTDATINGITPVNTKEATLDEEQTNAKLGTLAGGNQILDGATDKDTSAAAELDGGEVGVNTNIDSTVGGGEGDVDSTLDQEPTLFGEYEKNKINNETFNEYFTRTKKEKEGLKTIGEVKTVVEEKQVVEEKPVIEETVEQAWAEMSVSGIPFAELSTENKKRLAEAKKEAIEKEDPSLGITGDLVDQIDGELGFQESRTETQNTGETAETITTELVQEFGPNVNRMQESGRLVVVDSVEQLPANIKLSSTANGAYDSNTQTSYIVANRVKKGQGRRVLLHEIGEHHGLEKMVGKDYMSLLNRLKTLRKQNADIDALFDEVQTQYPELEVNSKPFLQEVMAKLGERAPNNTLFRRMVGAVKNFLRRLGIYDVNRFSDVDIQDMILNSLRVSLAETTGKSLASNTSAPSITDLGGVSVQESRTIMNAINPIIEKYGVADTSVGSAILSALSKIPDAAAGLYVKFLSIPNKIELFGKQIPGLESILNALQKKADEIKQAREEVNRTVKIGKETLEQYNEEVVTEWNTVLLELSRANVNPETALENDTYLNNLKKEDQDLVERYRRLDKPLRELAKLLVADLKVRYDTLLETMIATYPGAEAQLRDRFASLDYYLPMVRKGNNWFKYITKEGEEASSSADSPFLREQMKKKLAAQGATKFEDFTQAQLATVKGQAPAEFVENLKSTFGNLEELSEDARQAIIDTIEEQYLNLFPEQSLRNQESHRRGVPGYLNDVLFAYGDTAPKIIASTANARYNTEIVRAVNEVSGDTKDSPSAIVRAIGRDAVGTTPFYLNPVANIFASIPAYMSYVWFIGGNISSAFVNLTQLPLIVLPFLQGEYGFDNSQKALFDAIKMYANGGFEENRDFLPDRTMAPFKMNKKGERIYRDKEFAPGGKYYQLFKDAEEAAALRRGVGYEITELKKSLGSQVKSGAAFTTKAEAAVGYVFQNSERLNREVTLIAAFNLAKTKGLSDKDAIQKAIELTSKVHSHALPEAGPSLFQDGLGKVTFVFKRFAQAQVYLVSKLFKDVFATKPKTEKERQERDIARNQLLGVYGYSFLMAGVQGMPFYGGATILASLLFDDEDDPFDPHTAVNQAIGDIAYRGPLSAFLGIDISQRTGFRDLVFREDPARLEKIGAAAYMLEVIGGPGYSIARRGFEGIEMIANGEIGRGAERILPTAVGNALKTIRYNTDGMTNRYGAPIIEGDPSIYESFMQILGFSNIELSEAYTKSNALKGPERKLQTRRSQLLLQYFLAKQTGDTSGMKSVEKDIKRFNSKAPRSFKLTPKVLNKSAKARAKKVRESTYGSYVPASRRGDLEERYLPNLN